MVLIKEIASRLWLSEQQIRNLIRSGTLPGQKLGTQWIVKREDFEAFLALENKNSPAPSNHPRKGKKLPKIKALSFFSWAMWLDLGLEKAGIETILACEFDKSCRKTIEKNRPELALLWNIWEYSADDIRKSSGLSDSDDIEIIAGGPPCQAFSTAWARRWFEDERGNAFLKYVELITQLKPRYAVIENVRGLLSAPYPVTYNGKEYPIEWGALYTVLQILKKAGYSISFNLYNSANFWSPQARERVVVICSREWGKVPHLTPTHSEKGDFGLPKWRTFHSAVENLNCEHDYIPFPEKRLKYYRLLWPGQYWKHLPDELQKEAMGKSYYLGWWKTGFLRRIAWDKPAPTLVTHPAMPATDIWHPVEDRPLSVQEYKRVQEFPDHWNICWSTSDQYKQIGNAVPVSLWTAIGKAILSHMNWQVQDSIPDFPYSRYKETDEASWERKIESRLLALSEIERIQKASKEFDPSKKCALA